MTGTTRIGSATDGHRRRRLIAPLGGLAALTAAAVPASAALSSWTGVDAAAHPAWSDAANWTPLPPANDGTADVVYAATPLVPTATTVDVPYAIRSLTFAAAAPGYDVTAIGTATLSIGTGGVTDNATTAQAVDAPVNLSAAQTWSSAGTLTVNGTVAGTGPLTVAGTGTVVLTGSNTYSGGTTVNAGATLALSSEIGADTALGDPDAGLTLNGGTLRVGGPPAGVTNRTLTLGAAGGTISTDTGIFLAGPIVATSTLTKNGDGALTLQGDNATTFAGAVSLQRGSLYVSSFGDQPLGTAAVTAGGGTHLEVDGNITGSTASPFVTTVHLSGGTGGAFNVSAGGTRLLVAAAADDGSAVTTVVLGGNTDGTTANLARTGRGTLVVTPSTVSNTFAAPLANLGTLERVTVAGTGANLPAVTNGIVSPAIVGLPNDATPYADFLTYNGSAGFVAATNEVTTFTGPATAVVNAQGGAVPNSVAAYAVRLGANLALASTATLTVGDGTAAHPAGLILNGGTITGGTLAFGGSEGVVYGANRQNVITSTLTGTNGLTTFGPGVVTIGGAATYTGPTTVNGLLDAANLSGFPFPDGLLVSPTATLTGGGAVTVNPYATLAVDGRVSAPVTVNGGTLAGIGSVLAAVLVNPGGRIIPGLDAFNSVPAPGVLATGPLTLTPGASAVFDLFDNGGVTRADVTGTVALGSATLDVQTYGSSNVSSGTVVVLVNNDGTDPVTGTFAGVPQGGVVVASDGERFAVSYTGDATTGVFAGAGNDVLLTPALTAIPEPTGLVMTSALVGGRLLSRRRRAACEPLQAHGTAAGPPREPQRANPLTGGGTRSQTSPA